MSAAPPSQSRQAAARIPLRRYIRAIGLFLLFAANRLGFRAAGRCGGFGDGRWRRQTDDVSHLGGPWLKRSAVQQHDGLGFLSKASCGRASCRLRLGGETVHPVLEHIKAPPGFLLINPALLQLSHYRADVGLDCRRGFRFTRLRFWSSAQRRWTTIYLRLNFIYRNCSEIITLNDNC